MDLVAFNRVALPLALLAMGALVLALPILRVYRTTGVWLVVPHRSPRPVDRLMGYGGVVVLPLLLVLASVYAWRGPSALLVWQTPQWLGLLGWGALLAGVALIAVAQRQMGTSLRLGIDDRPTRLVLGGVYGHVRHPIYSGLLLTLAGLSGVAPSPWTVCGLAAAGFFFAIQTRLEEEHLLRVHGESYRAYASQTGRFVPWVGRLP
jgi:protein-S-isoprenylcysteine O-methyltransferase Ste14